MFPLHGSCFNSRTREGCDGLFPLPDYQRPGFQFTHPGGVRPLPHQGDRAPGLVSIHAPGRGATLDEVYLRLIFIRFNSRTREGCDTDLPSRSNSLIQFQFTHPGGVRLISRLPAPLCCESFNSRTREGCDIKIVGDLAVVAFQFTHPGGVRRHTAYLTRRALGFNSRTREGCDLFMINIFLHLSCFNSRTREGCDGDDDGRGY